MTSYALGIDLGGSSIKSVALGDQGQVLAQENVQFAPSLEMDWAKSIRELARAMQSRQDRGAQAIGLSAPGLVSHDGQSIAYMPGRLQGLEDLNWTTFLQSRTLVPVLNDAHAALVGEVESGAAAGLTNVVMLTLGTGVGGAAMVDGHLLRGHIGRAGHVGHLCLDPHGPSGITRIPGSLEYMIGNYSIQERSAGRFQSTHDLIAAYRAGDANAGEIWLRSVRALACAVASLVNVLDPQAIVIGGGIARAADDLFAPLTEVLAEVEWRPGGHKVEVRAAKLGEFAGAIGAAFHAWKRAG